MRFILKKYLHIKNILIIKLLTLQKRSIDKITRKKTEQIMIYIELQKQKKTS